MVAAAVGLPEVEVEQMSLEEVVELQGLGAVEAAMRAVQDPCFLEWFPSLRLLHGRSYCLERRVNWQKGWASSVPTSSRSCLFSWVTDVMIRRAMCMNRKFALWTHILQFQATLSYCREIPL